MSSSSPLTPTFYGHIGSTQDALILFEACLSGQLNHVARRPHDRERASLIKSGNVFIYEEHSSGIKRWTDGVPWSPSRILGNFLVYRELERPFPPGEKKRAMKRNKRSPGITKADPYPSRGPLTALSNGYASAAAFVGQNASKETERSLIGSLVDSYGFKEDGLVKKTISVTVNGVSHHLVSYYSVNDVMQKKLPNPSQDARFSHTVPRQELITKQNFRSAIDEVDAMDGAADRHSYGAYGAYGRNGYEMTNQTMAHRVPLPSPSINFYPTSSGLYSNTYNMYNGASGLPTPSYDTPLPTSTNPSYSTSQYAPTPGIYPAPSIKSESYKSDSYSPTSQRPRFASTAGLNTDTSRGQLSNGSSYGRRHSTFGPHSSVDSGVSGVSALSIDAKSSDQNGVYSSQNYFDSTRDSSQSAQSYAVQRALPTLSQTDYRQVDYNRNPSTSYMAVDHVTSKDSWSMGNQSNGHAHYGVSGVAAQPWASAAGS